MTRLQTALSSVKSMLVVSGITVTTLTSMLHLTPAVAADDAMEDHYKIQLGAFFVTRTNGQIRLDAVAAGPVTLGTSIDWERDLDGDTSMTAPRIDGFYRFTPKHRMDISWYKIDREGSIATQRDIEFGDVSFPNGTTLNSQFSTDTIKIAYTYSFYRASEIETAVTAGLHVTKLNAELSATNLGISEKSSTTAPLPVFGFRLDYVLSPKWTMRSKYELFFLDRVDAYKGAFSDFSLTAEHQTYKHVGFGFGLNRSDTTLEVNDGDKHGQFDSVLNGFMLYLVVR